MAPHLLLLTAKGSWISSWGAVHIERKIGGELVKRLGWSSKSMNLLRGQGTAAFASTKEPRCFSIYTGNLAKCRLPLLNCMSAMVRTPSLQSPWHKIHAVKWEVRVLK